MKKFFITLLCLCLAFSAYGCGKKDDDRKNAPISDITPATANEESLPNSSDDPDDSTSEAPERTPENDRKEIENNLRDAKQLIDDGCYDDAMMIINSLKTRDLTKEESEKLKALQKQMIKVSD